MWQAHVKNKAKITNAHIPTKRTNSKDFKKIMCRGVSKINAGAIVLRLFSPEVDHLIVCLMLGCTARCVPAPRVAGSSGSCSGQS